MKPSPTLRIFLLAAGSSLLVIPSAFAQSWSGTTNGDWLTTTNWTGEVAAGSTTSSDTDIAVFNVNANNTIGINMTTTGGVYYLGAIDNTNATARIIQNTSGTSGILTLNGATVNSVANTIIRNSQTQLLTIGNSGSGTLGLALGNATANVIQITSSGGITINSIISGSGGITRQGAGGGILTLSGNNSYTGVTAINVGVVSISNNNALGSIGTGNGTTIAATGNLATGGQLQLNGGINSAENITITGGTEISGFNGVIRNVSGNNTLSGNIVLSSLTSGVRFDTAGGTLIFSGNISQTGSSQSFSLAPTSGSTITVNNPIANNGGIFQTLSSGASGTSGTTILAAVNGTGIGATQVAQNSTLQLGISDALNTSANLNIAAFGNNDQGTFNLNGFNQTINALNSSATGANRIVRNNNATTASTLTVGNGGGTGSFNGTIVNGGAATLALVKTGTGNQTLSGINTFTGGTRIDAGTLTLGHATNTLADAGAVNVNGGTLALGTNTDIVGAVTLTSGSITGSGTASQGVLTGTGSAFDVRSGSVSTKLAGSVGLTKSTAGTVTLSATNTYTGATNINGGTLQLDGSTHASSTVAIGTAGTLTGTGTVNGNATLTGGGIINKASGTIAGTLGVTGGNWNGNGAVTGLVTSSSGTFTIGNGANLTANGNVNLTGGTIAAGNSSSTITGSLNYTSSSNSTFAGVIAGSGKTVTMNSANTKLSLSGVHGYTGATNITAGTLEISGTGSINSSSSISVASGAHFKYNSSNALTTSLTLSAGATLSGSGTIATAMTLNSLDSVLAPGNSPGIQTFGVSQTWASFTYEWELNDWVNSVVGTNTDQIQITGGLNLSGTAYALNILSLDALNVAGFVGAGGGNTFTETSKSWTILTTTTGISGFNASYWTLNTNGFQDAETGNWSLASTGNDLVLSYTVIPEPKAALLGGLGILLLFRRRR